MGVLILSLPDFQPEALGSRILLPLWLFWILIGLIGVLVILLLFRDKALRRSLKKAFLSARLRVKKARLESRIKRETREKEKALVELGQKAWSLGVQSEPAADVLKNIQALEQEKEGVLKEAAGVGTEIETLQKTHAKSRKSQEEKLKELEEKKSPLVEHLSQAKENLKQTEADLSHIEKEIRDADKGKTEAEKDITKIEANTQLSAEIKKIKSEELKARIFEMVKKKEDLEAKRPSIEEAKSKLLQQKTSDQNKIQEFDRMIAELQEEKKERHKVFENEMKERQKKKDNLMKKNREIEEQKQPLFARLGKALYDQRVEIPKLADIYARIETIDKAVQEYKAEREELDK